MTPSLIPYQQRRPRLPQQIPVLPLPETNEPLHDPGGPNRWLLFIALVLLILIGVPLLYSSLSSFFTQISELLSSVPRFIPKEWLGAVLWGGVLGLIFSVFVKLIRKI